MILSRQPCALYVKLVNTRTKQDSNYAKTARRDSLMQYQQALFAQTVKVVAHMLLPEQPFAPNVKLGHTKTKQGRNYAKTAWKENSERNLQVFLARIVKSAVHMMIPKKRFANSVELDTTRIRQARAYVKVAYEVSTASYLASHLVHSVLLVFTLLKVVAHCVLNVSLANMVQLIRERMKIWVAKAASQDYFKIRMERKIVEIQAPVTFPMQQEQHNRNHHGRHLLIAATVSI